MEKRMVREIGMMVVHSPSTPVLEVDLKLAQKLKLDCVEVLPRWKQLPVANQIQNQIQDHGLKVWSVHGPWGGQSIEALRVDLSDTDPIRRRESMSDLLWAMDWSAELGASVVVVHPGGLSQPEDLAERSAVLSENLQTLADEALARSLKLGLENMPKGVYPGSSMADLYQIVKHLNHAALGLVLDTGHAQLSQTIRSETAAASELLFSTHLHDNNGKSDSHLIPGEGVVDWQEFHKAIDEIGYNGPFILECVKILRQRPEIPDSLLGLLNFWRDQPTSITQSDSE
ncbi:MAG: hypothetical protein RJA81_640 [Planctomycetota bacterium]|jgi:sugar phosphate isomerase/epimerase